MPSLKYYIFNAVYQWAIDNGYTPYIAVDTKVPAVHLPSQFVGQNSVILNISPSAANQFSMEENDWLFFSTRFSGQSYDMKIPLQAVQAIYAKETSMGISFSGSQWTDSEGSPPEKRGSPTLKIIK